MADNIPHPRDAATIVIVRDVNDDPKILMGQRGASASFMPSKFVFPGGALDPADHQLAPHYSAHPADVEKLERNNASQINASTFALAAIRETWEETGLAIGGTSEMMGERTSGDEHWQSFFGAGLHPKASDLRFIFRAITPPTRSKRFDARFFIADAGTIFHDLDDFSRASGELSHLSWLTLPEARSMDLPFITEVVLAEVQARLQDFGADHPVPFFHHNSGRSYMDLL